MYRSGLLLVVVGLGLVAFGAEKVDPRVRTWIDPVRIVWTTEGMKSNDQGMKVENLGELLKPHTGQVPEAGMWKSLPTAKLIYRGKGPTPGFLLDFGREIHGGVQLGMAAGSTRGIKLRLRFGESVGEAMSEIGEKGATNDHALRDFELMVPSLGQIEVGNTGYRFLRVDLLTAGEAVFDYLRAVSLMRPLKNIGAFKSSDDRLNLVFDTALRTVQLCCQDYLWDGIKRDRLVWMGDSHPEFKTILAVNGADPVLLDSLDYMIATTNPECEWMNNMSSYTLMFLRDFHSLYLATGDRTILEQRREYLVKTVKLVLSTINERGEWTSPRMPFLDWPSQHDRVGTQAGLQGAAALALEEAAELMDVLDEKSTAAAARAAVGRLRELRPEPGECKQAAAMLALGGVRDPKEMYDLCLGRRGLKGVSTFYGYYMLEAMFAAEQKQAAIDTCRDYWAAMNDVGATSYWENFDITWTNNCSRLDELPVPGKKDIHGDFGEFCYSGYRHSLCHGWAGGPAAFCIERILGLRLIAPNTVEFKPFLGHLDWAEGALAVKGGRVAVTVKKDADGRYLTTVEAPPGIQVRQ